jgi:hypothetical protein
MAVKKAVIHEELSVTLEGKTVSIDKDGFTLDFDREEAEKVANAMLTVLRKTRREEDE